jgi:hypothetical protein
LGTPYRKRAFPHQHLPKTTKTETSRERVGRTWKTEHLNNFSDESRRNRDPGKEYSVRYKHKE